MSESLPAFADFHGRAAQIAHRVENRMAVRQCVSAKSRLDSSAPLNQPGSQ